MPSKGLGVDISNRNDVLAFWHAVYQASEGYQNRPIWREHPTDPNFYAADFTVPYSYTYNVNVEPPVMTKANGVPASGELNLGFVKDVERRVNFYRALVGVPASAKLLDSDTQKSSALVLLSAAYPTFQPPATTLKADAAQKSAYLIARTFKDKYGYGTHTWGTYHRFFEARINGVTAYNKIAWNGNFYSNLAIGFYGPGAIDQYINEGFENIESEENSAVGHRRGILAPASTSFATGDVPGVYNPSANDGLSNPIIRPPTNAFYVSQRPDEIPVPAASRYTPFPPDGFVPAPLNSPYWSLHHPEGNFTGATVSMTDGAGGAVVTGAPIVTTNTVSWPVSALVAETSIATDRTYNVTVSNFKISGVTASYTYRVRFINPDVITAHPTMSGSAAPPANGNATYFFTSPPEAEAVQVGIFKEIPSTWVEDGTTTPTKIVPDTYGNYQFISSAFPVTPSGGNAYHLSHPVRYDMNARGIPEQSFEIDRDILPSPAGTSKLKFSYRRAYMTIYSSMVVEKSDNEGASWTPLTTIPGPIIPVTPPTIPYTFPDAASTAAELTLPPSPTPLRIRFRFYKSGAGNNATYSEQDGAGNQLGIFIDNITTVNTTTYEQKSSTELPVTADRFTLNAETAGGSLAVATPLHLRFRSKLGNHWFQYGPAKIVTPTATPIPSFSGWVAYQYPTLTGGFNGDHDGDGEANAIEFAFYGDPLTAAKLPGDLIGVHAQAASQTDLVDRAETPNTLSISREIPAQRSGIDYDAEWSDNLATWSEEGVTVNFANGVITATVPAGPGKRFIRWKVTGQ